MRTTYEAAGWTKFIERDDYEKGWLGKESMQSGGDRFTGKTPEECIKDARDFFGIDAKDTDSIERDACEEPGRVDFARTERGDCEEPTKAEIEAWKAGKLELFYVVYTIYIERVTREAVSVAQKEGGE